jgi:hypothetical protein
MLNHSIWIYSYLKVTWICKIKVYVRISAFFPK